MKREYLLDINILLPEGETMADWKNIGHLWVDMLEGELHADGLDAMEEIIRRIRQWERSQDASRTHSISDS